MLIYIELIRKYLTIEQLGYLAKYLTLVGMSKVLTAAPLSQTYSRHNHINTENYNSNELSLIFIIFFLPNIILLIIVCYFFNLNIEPHTLAFCCLLLSLISLKKTFYFINLYKVPYIILSNLENFIFRIVLPMTIIFSSLSLNSAFIYVVLILFGIFALLFLFNYDLILKVPRSYDKNKFNKHFSIYLSTILTSIGSITITYFDRFFVELKMGTTSLGVLLLFSTMQNLTLSMFNLFTGALQNSEFLSKDDFGKIYYNLITIGLISIGLFTLTEPEILRSLYLKYGENFSNNLSYSQLCIAISTALIAVSCNVLSIFFYKNSVAYVLSFAWLAGGFINIIANLLLFPLYNFNGVLFATWISFSFILLFLWVYINVFVAEK